MKRILSYFLFAMILYVAGSAIDTGSAWLDMAARTPLLLIYIAAVVRFEHIPLPHK